MQEPQKKNILGYLISGGQATRMGGINKAGVCFRGVPMGERIIKTLSKQAAQVWVSANRDVDMFLKFGAKRVLKDRVEGSMGPLAGLEALEGEVPSEVEWILISPCDVPLLPEGLSDFFISHYRETPASILTISVGGKFQNTTALIHRSVLGTLKETLQAGDRKVGLWMQRMGALPCDWAGDPLSFANVNSKEELELLEKEAK